MKTSILLKDYDEFYIYLQSNILENLTEALKIIFNKIETSTKIENLFLVRGGTLNNVEFKEITYRPYTLDKKEIPQEILTYLEEILSFSLANFSPQK